MKRLLAVLVSLVALSGVTLAGCGDSETDDVRAVVELVASGDPEACAGMTRGFRELFGGSIEECERRMEGNREPPEELRITDVTVDGSEATVKLAGEEGSLVLVKDDGTWKIERVKRAQDREERSAEASNSPKIERGLGPRETVDAYLRSIDEEDGAALCGLLTGRHARKVLGGEPRATPIRDCVEALGDYDWTPAHRRAEGVRTLRVVRSAGGATVRLSSGKRALLKRVQGRWVIDDIKR